MCNESWEEIMICDNVKNAARYFAVHPLLKEGFAAIEKLLAEKAAPGTYPIRGEELWASVQSYESKTVLDLRFETHRRYIDLQYLVSGEEYIPCCPAEALADCEGYDEGEDISFYGEPPERFTSAHLRPGDFALFFPEDGHAPRIAVTRTAPVEKIVVKLAVE